MDQRNGPAMRESPRVPYRSASAEVSLFLRRRRLNALVTPGRRNDWSRSRRAAPLRRHLTGLGSQKHERALVARYAPDATRDERTPATFTRSRYVPGLARARARALPYTEVDESGETP